MSPKPDFTLDINRKTSVITLTVKEGLHKPYFYKSKAYCRNDSATVEVDTLELTRLILEGQNQTFESLKSQKQDLSFRYLEKAFQTTLGFQAFSRDILKTLEHVSVLEQFEKAMKMYRLYYQYEEIKETLRNVVEMIPAEAFREAIANAIIHRTWDVDAHI